MLSGKVRTVLSFAFIASLIFTSSAQAGLACRLEKEVPRYAVTGTSPITAKMFDSRTAATPVVEQDFRPKELQVTQYKGARGETVVYRVRMDFTNTDTLTGDMDLWWEFWLSGNRIGQREKVPQSAFAIFAAEAAAAGDADTVDGLHVGDLSLSVHGHAIGDISGVLPESQVDPAIARDSEVSSLITTHNHDSAYVNDDSGDVGDADVPAGALSPDRINGTAWTSQNDGSSSGLDADTLDGQDSSYYYKPHIAFSAYNSTDDARAAGWTVHDYNAVQFNHGNGYVASADQFRAPVRGVYNFSATVGVDGVENGRRLIICIYRNGTQFSQLSGVYVHTAERWQVYGGSATMSLNAGNTVEIRVYSDDDAYIHEGGLYYNHFSGHLVYQY